MDGPVLGVHTSFTMDSKLERLHYGLEMETQGALWLESTCPSLRLLEKNYRWKGGEIDLIFEDRVGEGRAKVGASEKPVGRTCELVFVEVRARKLGALVDGVVSITLPKQRRISRTIRHYLARYRGSAKSVRFDVLTWNGLNWSHLKNVRLEDQGIARYH